MAITNRELPAGTTLVAKYKGAEYRVLVVGDEEVGRAYELDGRIYKSPSAAGSAVMGGVACNGWRFWTVAGSEPVTPPGTRALAAAVGAAVKAAKAKKAKGPAAVKVIRRLPNQKGVAEGQTRWFCSACMKGFVAAGVAVPEACPEGHAKEAVDDLAPPA